MLARPEVQLQTILPAVQLREYAHHYLAVLPCTCDVLKHFHFENLEQNVESYRPISMFF